MIDSKAIAARLPAAFLLAALVLFDVMPAGAALIETVLVGNAGNMPRNASLDTYGGVEYDFRMGKYEVTNAEYAEFLNRVDAGGANQLALYNPLMSSDALGGITLNSGAASGLKYQVKPGRERNPVVYVSLYDAVRFTNWLHNGQGSGGTESGAYTLLGGRPIPTNFQSIGRNPGAQWWLPNNNEVVKAAYHKNDGATSNYWNYPFSSNAIPASDQPPGSDAPVPSNTGNFLQNDNLANGYNDGYAVTGSPTSPSSGSAQNYLTDVGAYSLSKSPYGAYDQGGNVAEWGDAENLSYAGFHGAAWGSGAASLHVNAGGGGGAGSNQRLEERFIGFRVAAAPEPPSGGFQQIAVDMDSSNPGYGDYPSAAPVRTEAGFRSWNASWSFTHTSWNKTQFLADGVEFDLQGFREGGPSADRPYRGSRIRPRPSTGEPHENLLEDFVFAEGSSGSFLYLTIAGLPVGTYRMTTWHYDSDFRNLSRQNHMQIEVGDQVADAIAAATSVVVDHFPLSKTPQVFEFEVTAAGGVKEIVFRNDDTLANPGAGGYRTRLNGFTLVRVPEPATLWLLLIGCAAGGQRRR